MAVGRITKNIFDKFKLKKYKKYNIPIRDKNLTWHLKCEDIINKDEFLYSGDALSVMGEYCNDSLVYYYCYGNLEKKNLRHRGPSHDHSFNAVLDTLYKFPNTFYIPEDCKCYYTERQLHFLKSLQKKLLADGLNDIGIFYEEHPLKQDYEECYLEYNEEELIKRNIENKKVI